MAGGPPAMPPMMPAVPGGPPMVKTAPQGGGEDFEAQIAALEQQKQDAINSQQFEKCTAIRDQINQIRVKQAAAGGGVEATFDQALFDKTFNGLDHKMKEAVAVEAYEKCPPLRDAKKTLEDLKAKYDVSGPSQKGAVLNELNQAIQNITATILI